jgi:Holliday junction resolvase RusA-like endonuclease
LQASRNKRRFVSYINKVQLLAHPHIMKITLPKPLTVNSLYGVSCRGGFAHKYMTEKGKVFIQECLYLLMPYKGQFLEGKLKLYLTLFYCSRGDIDNVFKITSDVLTKSGVITDDHQIYKIIGEKIKVKHKTDEKAIIELLHYEH